ncbi:hypothetical protein HMPREF0059_00742 [Actinomyces viscosus C505]|uniref:DUF4352 domain-containing protein n=1 Tax=Actinomyces viscosus C505 TaxID=562973 RepID=F2UWD8_ACTVI|nr:hypothetical protein HMPREF0059_00742 [Actinomyces viscosus C505]
MMMAMRTVRSADLHGVSPESSGSIVRGGVLPDSVVAEGGAARDGGRTLRHVSRTRMLILPAVLVLGLGLAACGGGKSQSTASPSASAAASASGSASAQAVPSNVATPTVQTAKPTAAPASPSEDVSTPDASSLDPKAVETGDLSKDEYPEVGLDKSVRVDGDLVISLGQMQAKDFASGPGEVGGAGILVPVTVTNKSGQDLPLASVLSTTVNYGEGAGTPASEIVSASDAVPATLAAGQTVTVNRAFVIPAEGRGNIKVVVDLGAGRGAATFRGSAG